MMVVSAVVITIDKYAMICEVVMFTSIEKYAVISKVVITIDKYLMISEVVVIDRYEWS